MTFKLVLIIVLFFFSLQNSIRHNLSLHSKFVRVQNEGTGKSSWWMLNPDAKPGGKTSRRRATSVEGGTGPGGGRGHDHRRRGRNKKSAAAAAAAAALRNGVSHGQTPLSAPGGGPGGTPSPNEGVPALQHIVNGGPIPVEGLYPESPSLHHPHQYPFGIPPGGRISPGMHGEHPGMPPPPFGYPGQQEWPAEYAGQCGMPPYFQGTI